MTDIERIRTLALVELSRRKGGFYYFCQLMIPEIYDNEKPYLKKICEDLENFYYDDTKKYLLMSIPPRHFKTTTIGLFICYLLSKDVNTKVMTGSYNEDASTMMCKKMRDRIQEEKKSKEIIVYNDIFDISIERGSAQAREFKLEGAHSTSVLSTSMNGKATGYGANIILIDDIIKSAEDSYNTRLKDKQYDWFTNTMLSRLEGEKQKVIIIGTRWAKDDLIGRVLDWHDEGTVEINIKAYDEKEDKMLCDAVLDKKGYEERKSRMSEEIFMANYQGIPLDLKDRLYSNFEIYDEKDILNEKGEKIDFNRVFAYVDTADSGADSLVMLICAYSTKIKDKIFVLDIYQTKDPMEHTERVVASKLDEFKVDYCRIEANNGGKGFARNVKRIYEEEFEGKICTIKSFTQTETKRTRIFTHRHDIQTKLYYPHNWELLWPMYFKEMVGMKSEGVNVHDDSADATTGIIETSKLFGIIK